jgi:hypothetical protein
MDYSNLKKLYLENILLVCILLFVIIYIIFNYSNIINGNLNSNYLVKSILFTGILILIIHLFITWDEENNNDEIIIEKFKLGDQKQQQNGYSKYKIVNNSLDNKSITNMADKLSNQNIFISHKNIGKYGVKF